MNEPYIVPENEIIRKGPLNKNKVSKLRHQGSKRQNIDYIPETKQIKSLFLFVITKFEPIRNHGTSYS